MIKRIIFITEFGFSKRDSERYGFDILKERGVDPVVLDIALLTRLGYLPGHEKPDKEHIKSLVTVKNEIELESYLSLLNSESIAICLVETRKENEFLFNTLNRLSIVYGFTFFGEQPLLDGSDPDFIDERGIPLNRELSKTSAFKITKALLRILFNSLLIIEIKRFLKGSFFLRYKYLTFQPRFVLVSGLKAHKKAKISFVNRNCKFLHTHSLDYDIVLKLKENNSSSQHTTNYSVFLDDCKPYHPDNLVMDIGMNLAPDKTPDDYYLELNNFFDLHEQNSDTKVIIAAHPRFNYKNLPFKPFRERELYYGRTVELIKNCSCVIGHNSTALGVAAIFNKPIVLLNSSTFSNYNNCCVNLFAKELGVRVIDLSFIKPLQNLDLGPKSRNSYKSYIAKYIKEENKSELNSWDYFLNSIEKF